MPVRFVPPSLVALTSPLVLNEVLYDPDGADGGLEFVEIAAAIGGDPASSLAGWILETGNGARPGEWTVAWTGAAGDRLVDGLFLVGESAVEPRPDAVVDLDLQNGPDGCRLRGPDGSADRVGWGAPLDAALVEGDAADDVSGGSSLARLPDGVDTDDNATDFRAASPTPGEFNAPAIAVLVEAFAFAIEGEGAEGGAHGPAVAAWDLRNVGREPWTGEVRLLCAAHPGELLLRRAAPGGAPLAPGERARVEARGDPPPGAHLPVPDPAPPPDGGGGGDDAGSPAWIGDGADLLLSEVLNRPADGGVEWVELRSTAARDVDLGAYRLADLAGTAAALAGTLAPGAFAVVAPDSLALRAEWAIPAAALVVEGSPWPSLNHTGPAGEAAERIALVLRSGGSPGPAGPAETAVAAVPGGADAGVAWERVSRSLDGADLAAWAPSLAPTGGTPGRTNVRDGDRPAPATAATLAITPSPFRPDRDGTALLVVRPGRPVDACRVTLYDSSGRRVAPLDAWAVTALEHRALWDGRSEDGEPVALGLYLAVAEVGGSPPARAPLVVIR